jgi:hypothetical protein
MRITSAAELPTLPTLPVVEEQEGVEGGVLEAFRN